MDQTLNTLLDGYGAASEAGPCPRYIYQGQRGFREPGMHATLVDGVAWIDEQEELKSSGNNLLSSSKPSFGSGQLPGSDQRLSRPRAACVPYTNWTAFSRISGSSSVRHLVHVRWYFCTAIIQPCVPSSLPSSLRGRLWRVFGRIRFADQNGAV
jgi:hypothetical protein